MRPGHNKSMTLEPSKSTIPSPVGRLQEGTCGTAIQIAPTLLYWTWWVCDLSGSRHSEKEHPINMLFVKKRNRLLWKCRKEMFIKGEQRTVDARRETFTVDRHSLHGLEEMEIINAFFSSFLITNWRNKPPQILGNCGAMEVGYISPGPVDQTWWE